MKKIIFIFILLSVLSMAGCAEVLTELKKFNFNLPLTKTEIVNGLKEALITGSKSAAGKLGAVDGYYNDTILKIMLPDEAAIILNNITKIPGGQAIVDDVILRINRSAEDAASGAAPIFIQSIKKMAIADAVNILNGADNAATQYFRDTAFDQLFQLYQPKIKDSLDKKLLGLISTNDSWNKLTGEWNRLSSSRLGKTAGLKPVEIDLNEYLTNKALNGLFVKIEEEELQIRKDPLARVAPILKRVFGSLDTKK